MSSYPLVTGLSLFTLVVVLGVGVLQLKRVRASQTRRGETPGSSITGSSSDSKP